MKPHLSQYIYDVYKDLSNQNSKSQHQYELFHLIMNYKMFEEIYFLSGKLEELNVKAIS